MATENDLSTRYLIGDCRDVLGTLPDESVHCVVTSPPYWWLRDYGVAGQIGLEPDFNTYIARMVAVFRDVRRVLRKDGTLWLNLGDSYAGGGHGGGGSFDSERNWRSGNPINGGNTNRDGLGRVTSLKPKDLCGIPWRVAFALQADGWWLRQDIIWSKPNPMPESVTDRCTKAHEYIFLMSKSARYYYDAEAIKEEELHPGASAKQITYQQSKRNADGTKSYRKGNISDSIGTWSGHGQYVGGRNKRSVWEIATAPFSEAHFATFPPALIEPCIKAGTSEKGCCAKCGAPWVRQVGKHEIDDTRPLARQNIYEPEVTKFGQGRNAKGSTTWGHYLKPKPMLGWSPSCSCEASVVPATVLDCFGGAGTTGLVADRLQRNAVLIELNPEYAEMAKRRVIDDAPLFAWAAQ